MRPLARNAFANVARIGSGMAISVVVSALLERRLSRSEFSAWSLAVQLAALFALLDLGMQSVVSRFVAEATARHDGSAVNRTVSTAVAMQSAVALAGLAPLALVVAFVPRLFPDMPHGIVGDARLGIAAIGIANLATLPASAWSAHLLGTLRTEPLALITIAGRLVGGAAVIAADAFGAHVGMLGIAFGSAIIATAAAQILFTRARAHELDVRMAHVTTGHARRLGAYGAPLAVWMAAGFFVSGLDTTIVGRVEFDAVPAYAIAALGTGVLGALHGAFLGPFLPTFAALHARSELDELRELLGRVLRWSSVALVAISVALISLAPWLLRLWVGPDLGAQATPLLRVLLAANAIRLFGSPFASLLIATAEHRRVLLSPIAEALVNLTASIVLGLAIGSIGVAVGTVLGAAVSLGLHFGRNMGKITWLRLQPTRLAVESILLPVVCGAPVAACLLTGGRTSPAALLLAVAAATIALFALWARALTAEDRDAIRSGARTVLLSR